MTRESYHDYMGRRMREEDEKLKTKTITETQLFEDQIRELNSSYYSCINRVKDLIDENQQLKDEIKELKNNANI